MTTQTRNPQALLNEALRQKRRALACSSPEAFARIYLGGHFSRPGAAMHTDLFGMFLQATQQRGARIAVAAPRCHAKSTVVSLACVLWAAATEAEPFIWIISSTLEQAQHLLSPIREQLETNELLRLDFPGASVVPPTRKPKPWRGKLIEFPNGCQIKAVGLDQQVRGIRHRQHRPSLIVLDDAEHLEHVKSEEQREKTREVFERTFLKAGDEGTNVVMLGTVMHQDSLLARLIDPDASPGWASRRYQAIVAWPERMDLWDRWEDIFRKRTPWEGADGPEAAEAFLTAHREEMHEGAEVLWPAQHSLESLMLARECEGRASFSSEMMNDPLDPEQCLFADAELAFWDDEHGSVEELLEASSDRVGLVGAWDPSLGRRGGQGDYSAFVILAYDPETEIRSVVEADLRRCKPDTMIERILGYLRQYELKLVGVESNGFQELLLKDLQRRAAEENLAPRLCEVSNTGDKQGRIEALEPLVARGLLRFSRQQRDLLKQLRAFPTAKHDDGPDALEMAVRLAQPGSCGCMGFGGGFSSHDMWGPHGPGVRWA